MQLTKHDSRLVTAAISYLLAISTSGNEGAVAVNSIKDTRARSMMKDATKILAAAKEGMDESSLATVSSETWLANLDRLQDIAKGLLGEKEVQTATLEPIGTDGKSTGPKQYQLWLTHEQIHLVHWAVMFAEGGINRDPLAMLKALTAYETTRGELDAFVDKFNQVHEAARVEDGEVH